MNVISTSMPTAEAILPAAVPDGRKVAAHAPPSGSHSPRHPLHRLREVRRREGILPTRIARHLGLPLQEIDRQERPSSDIRLSDLYRWAKALEVPVAELLHEPDGNLSPPVQLRARLLRVMKTVRSLQESAQQPCIRRLADTLIKQLIEVMPELEDTVAWPTFGQQRKRDELGQAFFRGLSIGALEEAEETY